MIDGEDIKRAGGAAQVTIAGQTGKTQVPTVTEQPATAHPQPSALVQPPEAGKNWNTDRTTFGPREVPPQGLFEDPALKKEAELAALPRSALASRVTEITRKMRVFDRGWLYEGPPAPDAPQTTTGEGEDYKNEMAFYNERMKEWHAEKDRSLQKFRNLFQQQFAAEMFVLNELVNRFQEVRSSSECQAVFSGTFYNGQLSGCADYLDKIVREKLD
jgi:hypothetical protein